MSVANNDTIAAIATASGQGGVGIVRLSGPNALAIATAITKQQLVARHATFTHFLDPSDSVIDEGLVLYFQAPHSFTGEDVVEFQGHGGSVVLDQLLQCVLSQGARMAKPGEFSERAFLNGKLDLVQAEAVADLIAAESVQAARSAMRTLQGQFSKHIHELVEQVIKLRMYVEAAIDFPEEEIDFLAETTLVADTQKVIAQCQTVLATAKQGSLLKEGIALVLAGPPNAGKSSLLNVLSGQDHAIVTNIPGTTRDVLREKILLRGVPIHLVDTAGLRDSTDVVEQEGIKRAKQAVQQADVILLVFDATTVVEKDTQVLMAELFDTLPDCPVIMVKNKIDLLATDQKYIDEKAVSTVAISTKNRQGIEALIDKILAIVGYGSRTEGAFSARRRHVTALTQALSHIQQGLLQLTDYRAGELFAEELRQAQQHLSQITGEFTSDDLLGEIFSSFCIGK